MFPRFFLLNIFLTLFAFGSSSAFSSESASFTIQQAVIRALDTNPDVLKAREAIRQAEASQSFALANIFPTVNGSVSAAHLKAASNSSNPPFSGDPYNQYTARLDLSQPIFDSALFPAFRFSQKDQQIRRYAATITERSVTESVLESFYSVLLNERLLEIYKETQKLDNETLAIAERYSRIGRAQKLDVLQLKTQVALLTPKIAQTESQMRTAAGQLATLLRSLDASAIRLRGAFVTPESDWVQQTIKKARGDLPELMQARETVNQFEDTRDLQMAVYWPRLSLLANTQRSGYLKHDLVDDKATSWGVSLNLNVPIFAGLSSFRQREALASQERQLELDETRTADTVSVAQIQTEHDFEVAKTQLNSSRQAATYGSESFKEAHRTYRLQMINYLQYQSSVQAYLDSQVGYLQAKYNYLLSLSKYFNALGVPSSILIAKIEELSRAAVKE